MPPGTEGSNPSLSAVRRARGTGSIADLGGGKYRLRHYIGVDPVTGKARQASKTVTAKNVTEARRQLVAFVASHEGQVLNSTMTVETLMAEYIRSLETKRRSIRTLAEAKRTTDRVIVPALGSVPIGELRGVEVDKMIRAYARRSSETVRRYVAVLSAALGFAVRQGWLDKNPVVQASVPEKVHSAPVMPTQDELLVLIAAMPSEVTRMALRLCVWTAARRGEVCALRWTDLEDGALHIRRSITRHAGESVETVTKGKRERKVALSEGALESLYLWGLECMATAEHAGIDLAADSFILSPRPDGAGPLNPDTLSSHVYRATRDLGWKHIHLHSIRHYGATQLLAQGMNARDAAEILGHADGGKLLLGTYAHPTTERQRAAGAILGNLLEAPKEEP